MNFQELLNELDHDAFIEVLKKWNVDEKEQKQYLSFIEKLLTMKPIETAAELMIDTTVEKFEVGVLEDGRFCAIDFIDWDEVLAYTVNKEEIEKVTTIEEFAFCVLYDMTFDGFDQETRKDTIDKIKNRKSDNEE